MTLDKRHFPLLGLGISAVAAIVAILYYRNQSAASTANSGDSSALGSFPYFQTAALPSSNIATNDSTGIPAGSSSDATTPLDLNAIAAMQSELQLSTTTSNNAVTTQSNWLDLLAQNTAGLISSIQATNQGGTGIIQAYLNPRADGGFTYGVEAVPVNAGPAPYNAFGANAGLPSSNLPLGGNSTGGVPSSLSILSNGPALTYVNPDPGASQGIGA